MIFRSFRSAQVSVLLFSFVACSSDPAATTETRSLGPGSPNAEAIVLVRHPGDSELDQRIRHRQNEVRQASSERRAAHLERLGTLFIAKARRSHDVGFYKIAEQCAVAMEAIDPGNAGALLLRGHVFHSLHRFQDAERLARQLVAKRGLFLDHGLLGDVLLDRGELEAALASYQKMLDLKPCLQSYSRAARVRFLRGDLDSAKKLLDLATGAGSVRAPESLAWTYARLALIEFQLGNREAARDACRSALKLVPDYAPALLTEGRILLIEGQKDMAVAALRRASEANPLPEYRWHFVEALASAGRTTEAALVDVALRRTGAKEDPRTFALYLLSRGRDPERALELARTEIAERQDVYTHDVNAWALLANGKPVAAWREMERALSQGTVDARLFYHAGAIASANGEMERAKRLLSRADELEHMLLPSERRDLRRRRAAL